VPVFNQILQQERIDHVAFLRLAF